MPAVPGTRVFACTEGHPSSPGEQRILVPIRVRTITYERREIPRDRRRQPYTIQWQSVEIVEERPYCPLHAPSVIPTVEPSTKVVHLDDHELPPARYGE
jgi:hypothetical protein